MTQADLMMALGRVDWWALFLHFTVLSLLAVGGAIATAPDMHRYLVDQQRWLTDLQFTTGIALAQAAPGPNVLFVALLGWQVGMNAASGLSTGWAWPFGLLGMTLAMLGMLLPSSILTYTATRWAHRHQRHLGIRVFKAGMAPIVVALLMATGWLLAQGQGSSQSNGALWGLSAASALLVWKTRLHMLWFLAAGGLLGGMGWV